MNTREVLINDIEKFSTEFTRLYKESREVKKSEYFELLTRINSLNIKDFASEEKYNDFIQYYNHIFHLGDRNALENIIQQDSLDATSISVLKDRLSGIINKLK